MRKVLIIGKGGQVSENLISLFAKEKDFEVLALGHLELDLSRPQEIYPKLKALNFKPEIIINAAAYTAVDLAETERDACNNINNIAVREIAKYVSKIQALLVHYSTDYVFDGAGTQPFLEDNKFSQKPLNQYGQTKLDGEKQVIESGCEYLILRTSWVYNHAGKNFVLTMLKLAAERDELKIIDDQVGSPTYAYDIADVTIKVLKSFKGRSDIYHIVPDERLSWFDFTRMIVTKARIFGFPIKVKNILPIKTSEYPTAAKRPQNSRLSTQKLKDDYGLKLPEIELSLMQCLKRIRDKV